MNIRKDILGRVPKIGDTIVFNPPRYKGIVYGTCLEIKHGSGLPIVGNLSKKIDTYDSDKDGNQIYTPKTGFVIAYER